jgi:hypothetical protein
MEIQKIMKYSFVIFASIFYLLMPQIAMGETLKEEANRLCKAFIEHPEDFKEITDTQSCDVYGQSPKSPWKAKCFFHTISGDSTPIKFVNGEVDGGTCHSDHVMAVSEGEYPKVADIELRNPNVNGYSMGRDDKPLDYKGTLLLTNQYNSDLRLVTKEDPVPQHQSKGAFNSVILCGIRHQLQGWENTNKNSASICEKLAKDEFQEPEVKHTNDNNEIVDVDLDGDGKTEKVLTIEISSGGGCGCGAVSLAIVNSGSEVIEKTTVMNNKLSKLTKDPRGCSRTGSSWSAINIDGRGYIAENTWRAKDKPIELNDGKPPLLLPMLSEKWFHDRALYKYEDGDFSEICRLKAKSKRVIDNDIYPDFMLGYVPVK